ncbi:alkane 1-monooxygenase [Chitinivorax sp. B]|uniref:alkane 1-monooxygenase n=1 Tax=Chitinivorax sp. B TaxID=2502235 RepID=UPI0010F7557D|nr:alkane 1-monooxygenase [Chitinivorax sp. B]
MQTIWKTIKQFAYLIVFIVPAMVMAGAVWGGIWSFLTPLTAFGLIPLIDLLVGEDRTNYSDAETQQLDTALYYRLITWLFVPAYYLTLGMLLYRTMTVEWPLANLIGNMWSMGILGGILIVVAHELGHKHNRFEKWLAKVLLHAVWYGHFMNEHNRGHHALVSTPEDPASARLGESFYRFLPRTIVGTFRKACELENERLARLGHPAWHWQNEMYRNVLIPLAVLVMIIVIGERLALGKGWLMGTIFVAQAAIGIVLLEVVNYLEHYGLTRARLPDGRYERVQPIHSWNANHLVSNCFLYHLQRHADHHTWPGRRYQTLRAFDEAPQLPTGYAGMIWLAAIPPLWFAVMNPRVDAFARTRQTVPQPGV